MITVDAKGLACPQPVILAKKTINAGEASFVVLVDNMTAAENLTRLGESNQFVVTHRQQDDVFEVNFLKNGMAAPTEKSVILPVVSSNDGTWAVFAASDTIGQGELELGASLMKMFFYTLAQQEKAPDWLLFMNAGVKLTCDEEITAHLEQLAQKGAEILVCGTCLNFYGIKEQLKIGTVSNMYDILERMQVADKVVSL